VLVLVLHKTKKKPDLEDADEACRRCQFGDEGCTRCYVDTMHDIVDGNYGVSVVSARFFKDIGDAGKLT